MRKITVIIICFLIYQSCGEYQKVVKSDNYNYKYTKAVEYYKANQFNRAMPLFNELSTVLIGSSKMEEVAYYYAYCNYSIGDRLMAAYLFKNYTINYPTGKHIEECAYMSAYCYYLEAPDYSLDATNTYKAIKELQKFINAYPTSSKLKKCNSLIDELRGKLAKKDFENAKQYFITENYKAAIIALDNLLIDFPSLNNREEVYFLIIKSSYLLAVNSINSKIEDRLNSTIDAYIQFRDNYPESDYLKELEATYNNTLKKLNQFKKNQDEI